MLPSGARFHYSNLAFALLGIVVERVSGLPYQDYVRERLLEPLGLTRMSFEPEQPAAKGYLAQPYADGVWETVGVETGAWASAGPAVGNGRATSAAGARSSPIPTSRCSRRRAPRRCAPCRRSPTTSAGCSGYGLGLGLTRDGERILAGHGGSMPGFIARSYFSAKDKVVVALLTNESEADIGELGVALAGDDGRASGRLRPKPWRVGEPPPDDVVPLLGIWFMEATRIVFRWRDGKLEARFDGIPDWQPSSVFEREADDRWRTVSGPEHGEALRIVRDGGRLDRADGLGRLPGHARARPLARARVAATRTGAPAGR